MLRINYTFYFLFNKFLYPLELFAYPRLRTSALGQCCSRGHTFWHVFEFYVKISVQIINTLTLLSEFFKQRYFDKTVNLRICLCNRRSQKLCSSLKLLDSYTISFTTLPFKSTTHTNSKWSRSKSKIWDHDLSIKSQPQPKP